MPYRGIKKGNYVSCNQKNYKVDDIIKDQRTGEDAFYKLEDYPGIWVHASLTNYVDISALYNRRRHWKVEYLLNNRQYPPFKYVHEFQNAYKKAYGRPWRGTL